MTDTNNLKKVQSRRFMARFDLPVQDIAHYTEDQLRQLFFDACCPVNKDGARRWKVWGQLEKGTNGGRWHYQLYYEAFDGASGTPIRADTIVKAIRSVTDVDGKTVSVYIKKASKTSERCVAYVTKEKTRVFGPWSNVPETEWPTRDEHPSGKACRDDLFQAIMSDGLTMHDVLDTPELSVVASSCMQWAERMEKEYQRVQWGDGSPRRSMEVIYLYGDTYSGKSTVAREWLSETVGARGYFTLSDYDRDPWDGYACELGLLMDDLRLPTSKIGLQEMLQLLDGFPYQLSRRYANTWAAFSHVVITSNWSPDKQWQSMRNASSLRSPLSEEDKLAFYRRFTRVLHVDKHGKISDETAVYRNGVDEREHVTLDDLKSALSKPVLKNCLYDETDFQYSLDNLSIVSGS